MKLMTRNWLILVLALCNLTNAQTTETTDAPPPTTRMRMETNKTKQAEALSALLAALGRISEDPSLVTAQETFDALDKGYTELKRLEGSCNSVIAATRYELASIKKDSAYTDEQKTELETAAKEITDQCETIIKEANIVINNLSKAPKKLGQAKRIYKSYVNLQGETQAKEKLKAAINEYSSNLTIAPVETPPADAKLKLDKATPDAAPPEAAAPEAAAPEAEGLKAESAPAQ